jgi:tetratricopeptide (TPR) repeat protein
MAVVKSLKLSSKQWEDLYHRYIYGKTVFILSNDDHTRTYLGRFLRQAARPPQHVIMAKNLTEARSRFLKFNVDIVISEYNFANEQGISILDKIRKMGEDSNNLSIVLIQRDQDPKKMELPDPYRVSFLTDPFRLGELKKSVVTACHSEKLKARYEQYLAAAKRYLRERQFSKAKESIGLALNEADKSDAHFLLGRVFNAEKNYTLAIQSLELALKKLPIGSPSVFIEIDKFKAFYSQGDHEKALGLYTDDLIGQMRISGYLPMLVDSALKTGDRKNYEHFFEEFSKFYGSDERKSVFIVLEATAYYLKTFRADLRFRELVFKHGLELSSQAGDYSVQDQIMVAYFDKTYGPKTLADLEKVMESYDIHPDFYPLLELYFYNEHRNFDRALQLSLELLKKPTSFGPLVYRICLSIIALNPQKQVLADGLFKQAIERYPEQEHFFNILRVELSLAA